MLRQQTDTFNFLSAKETNMAQVEDIKRELVQIFFSQISIIMRVTFLIFIGAVLISFLWPPTFAANGTILVKGKKVEKNPDSLEDVQLRANPIQTEDLYSEAQFLISRDVIEMTVNALKDRGFYAAADKMDDQGFLKAVGRLKDNLKTEVLPASNVVSVTYFDKNPDDAATTLEVLMNNYILFRMQVYNPPDSEKFFGTQADKFNNSLMAKEAELMELVEKTRISDPQKVIENNILILNDLGVQYNTLKSLVIEKELNVSKLEHALNNPEIQYFSFIENPLLNGLSAKLLELVTERGNVARIYHPDSARVKAIDDQINKAYTGLKAEVGAYKGNVENDLRILNEKISYIERRIDEIKTNNVDLQRQLIESNRIARETAYLQFSYDKFAKRREEAGINSSDDQTNLSSYVSILSKAFAPSSPVFPKKKLIIPLGLIVGFITGCSLGFIRDYLDHTFKKPSDVSNVAELPLLFSIPDWSNS